MQLLQQIYTDCPENIAIPLEYQHRKVRIIILPLEEDFIHPAWQKDYIENALGKWEGDLQRPPQPECEDRELF